MSIFFPLGIFRSYYLKFFFIEFKLHKLFLGSILGPLDSRLYSESPQQSVHGLFPHADLSVS